MSSVYTLQEAPTALLSDLNARYQQEATQGGQFTIPQPHGQDTSALWDQVPELDSKVVPKFSPIFKRHLGVPMRVGMIKKGGYASRDEFLTHMVPQMLEAAVAAGTWAPEVIA